MEAVPVTLDHANIGGSGYAVKADERYVVHEVRFLLRSDGRVPFSASTWQFSASTEL